MVSNCVRFRVLSDFLSSSVVVIVVLVLVLAAVSAAAAAVAPPLMILISFFFVFGKNLAIYSDSNLLPPPPPPLPPSPPSPPPPPCTGCFCHPILIKYISTAGFWNFPSISCLGGGGWQLVRHVPAGNSWHPATDGLAGTSVYGTYQTSLTTSGAFSIPFSFGSVNEFLFATGDMQVWLKAPPSCVYSGSTYSNAQRQITCSSQSPNPSTAAWYNRGTMSNPEDPWISTIDHTSAITAGQIVYGENSYTGILATNVLPLHGGANVFIR